MTKNTKEIKEFIKEYHDFLTANNIDVAQSTIGDTWFVYQLEKEYNNYNYFIRFTNVNQLVDIILDEFKFELYSAIKKEIHPPYCDDDSILSICEDYTPSNKTIPELTSLLNMILSSEYGKDSRFFHTLDKLFKRSARNSSSKMN